MIRSLAAPVVALTFLALTLVGGVRAARAGTAMATLERRLAETVSGTEQDVPLAGIRASVLTGPRAGAALDLGEVERGILLIFDPTCGPCSKNMANWTDLMLALQGGPAELYALTLRPGRGAAEYWRPWDQVAPVLVIDTAAMIEEIGVGATPTTLVVEDGRVVRRLDGMLQAPAIAELIRGARRPRSGD